MYHKIYHPIDIEALKKASTFDAFIFAELRHAIDSFDATEINRLRVRLCWRHAEKQLYVVCVDTIQGLPESTAWAWHACKHDSPMEPHDDLGSALVSAVSHAAKHDVDVNIARAPLKIPKSVRAAALRKASTKKGRFRIEEP